MHTCHLSQRQTISPVRSLWNLAALLSKSQLNPDSSPPALEEGMNNHMRVAGQAWRTAWIMPQCGGGGRCVWCAWGRQGGGWRQCFYFSQLLWKELRELKSKEQRWNNVQDLTKAAALLYGPPAVACLCGGSVQWVISHTQMLGRALPPGKQGAGLPSAHLELSKVQL